MSEFDEDLAALRRRLAEAEDTLRAIREGEVDALLVRDKEEDQVFHLSGGDESYRAFMEAMDLGAAALDENRCVLYVNANLVELLQRPPAILRRDGLLPALGHAAAELVKDLLERSRAGRQSVQVMLDGPRKRHLVVTAAPLPLIFATGWAVTFTDISQRVDAASAEEGERIGHAILASANEAMLVCDVNGIVTHANPAVLNILNASPVGSRFEDAVALSFAPGAGPMLADDLIAVALGGTSLRGVEASVLSDAKVKDLLVSAAPLRHVGGAIGGCTITLVDLTARKELERRQALLMRELGHRMKNMLALVLSISARTVATAVDLRDFKERFSQRLSALAETQNLLADRGWEGLSVGDLLEVELAPYVAPRGPRVVTRGLSIDVSRDAAVALGLVFHELVTNAVKYGSLSNETGRVFVSASPMPDGGMELVWREEGGPEVKPPAKSGFGQTIIARGLGQSASENTSVEFRPEGLICRMKLAPSALHPARADG